MLHVRNTLTSAASEGARYAAPQAVTSPTARRVPAAVTGALAGRFAQQVTAVPDDVQGAPGVEVRVVADVLRWACGARPCSSSPQATRSRRRRREAGAAPAR